MSRFRLPLVAAAGCVLISVLASGASVSAARLTSAQRRELSDIRRDIRRSNVLARRKKTTEAQKKLDDAQERFNEFSMKVGLNKNDKLFLSVRKQIQLVRMAIERGKGGDKKTAGGVSFEKKVAPILRKHCLGCHGSRGSGGLRLDTFAGMEKGGKSGPLLKIRSAAESLIVKRLRATDGRRMPKGKPALTATELRTIATWINQGARFDGTSKTARIGSAGKKKRPVKVVVARPTGKETVSFKKDIAPFMVGLCLGCHNDRRKSGDFSMETFYKLMTGGKSGVVVIGGKLDKSRMWDLAGKQDPFKMPRGQGRITRTNWRNLRTWIEEGAKYDGGDPKLPLRRLVPTEAEILAAELAALTPEQFVERRRKQTADQWQRVLPRAKPRTLDGKEFVLYGDVTAARLAQIDKWAEEHALSLRKLFGVKHGLLFKGKLAIFVFKDRFGYEEFNQVINRREIPQEVVGHSDVTANFETAYVALQDIGDEPSGSSAGMRINLIEHLTAAFLKRGGGKLPEWLLRGTGLALAARSNPSGTYFKSMRIRVPQMLASVDKPESIFVDGTFAPSDVGAVGYTLVTFLMRTGGTGRFGRLIASLQKGTKLDAAFRRVYRTDRRGMARVYAASLVKKRIR